MNIITILVKKGKRITIKFALRRNVFERLENSDKNQLKSVVNAFWMPNTHSSSIHNDLKDELGYTNNILKVGDDTSGLISELSLVGSKVLKGSATVISGYAPTWGNDYTDVIVVTSSRVVTLPKNADKCRVVLIGGGHGGAVGGTGGTGQTASGRYQNGGSGGLGGVGGNGGRIIEPVIGDDCGGISFDCKIGTGGAGGTSSNPNGSSGKDSTIAYSKGGQSYFLTTASGSPSFSGFQDFLSPANVYGAPGESGISGAKGGGSDGDPGSIVYNGVTYTGGTKRADSQAEFGGDTSGTLVNDERWTNATPAIYLTVTYTASNGNVQFNVSVRKPSGWYEYAMYVKITLGGSSQTITLQKQTWTSQSGSCNISGSGYCSVEMWASGGERTDVTTMYSGYIDASEPFIRTYHYGFGSGAVVAKNGTNNTSISGAEGVAATVAGANATVRGCGGAGGNGGSGGGAGGWYQDSNTGSTQNYSGGIGGKGSAGGNGADGIILIYYGKEVE